MICRYCGAAFRRENLKYCPYCDMEIPEADSPANAEKETCVPAKKSRPEWNPELLTETHILAEPHPDEICGTVTITVKGNSNLLSPATGTNYVMLFDGDAYQVRVTKGDQDLSESLKLPIGKHEGRLQCYSWNDQQFQHPETTANDRVTIEVKENTATEVVIKTGTVFSSRKIEIH